jgi:hypothetical protein
MSQKNIYVKMNFGITKKHKTKKNSLDIAWDKQN